MPLPQPHQPESRSTAEGVSAPSVDDHYFDIAHGDVASLHSRIERSLRNSEIAAMPHSPTVDRLEQGIQAVSRGAGVVGLLAALALIAYAII